MTHRHCLNLLDQLPGESAYKTAVLDSLSDEELAKLGEQPREGRGRWSHSALLQADEIDALRQIAYILIKVNGGAAKPPQPYPRPGVQAKRRRALSEEGRAYLQRLRDNGGATERPMTLIHSQ